MPEFYVPAFVRVEAASREEAWEMLPQEWHDDGAPVEIESGEAYVGWLSPERIEEGDLTEEEQARAEYLRRWGFGPPVIAPSAVSDAAR